MATCVNCPNEAVHHVADPGVNPLDFCDPCLPAHWRGRALAGHFAVPDEAPDTEVEAPKPAARKRQ